MRTRLLIPLLAAVAASLVLAGPAPAASQRIVTLSPFTANALAARHPHLVRRLLIVDVTPGTTAEKAKHITDFVNGPPFASIYGESSQAPWSVFFDRRILKLSMQTIIRNPSRSDCSST